MNKKIKIGIGAPTYNSTQRLEQLLYSMQLYSDKNYDVRIVILDDGTPDTQKREGIRELAIQFGVNFIQHEHNEGIPKSWNDLTAHFDSETKYVILFNDDIIVSQNWLRNFVYFMENNIQVGSVGFSIVHINPITNLPDEQYTSPSEDAIPARVGSANGCSFGFRRSLWEKIIQPDGSVGFWVSLISFYEELDFNFEIAKMGYQIFQMPTPLLEHQESRTFSLNQILTYRQPSSYFLIDEYLTKLKENKNLWIPYYHHEELALKHNLVLRMDYARMMYARKWGCVDYINNPQAEVHHKYIDSQEQLLIKWLDRNGDEKQQFI